MNADGSDEQRLTERPAGDFVPGWSPDEAFIAFSSDGQIYVMTPVGTDLLRLTETPANDWPDWAP